MTDLTGKQDPMYEPIKRWVIENKKIGLDALFRQFAGVGYGRLGKVISALQADGVADKSTVLVDKYQPPQASGIEAQVCADIAKRQQLGLAKYGTSVADNPALFRAWLQHVYEECLDQAVYLKKAIELYDQEK